MPGKFLLKLEEAIRGMSSEVTVGDVGNGRQNVRNLKVIQGHCKEIALAHICKLSFSESEEVWDQSRQCQASLIKFLS